jgi:hypothetical protein
MTDQGEAPADQPLPEPGRMLPREKQAGYGVALFLVAATGAIGGSKVIQGYHGKTNYTLYTILGIVAALAIAGAVYRGRRMITAFVTVLAGLAVASFGAVSYICLIYAGYVMFRHSQDQKKLNKLVPRGSRPTRSSRSRRSAKAEEPATGPAGRRPTANRRYTPPKTKARRSADRPKP